MWGLQVVCEDFLGQHLFVFTLPLSAMEKFPKGGGFRSVRPLSQEIAPCEPKVTKQF